MTTKNVPQDEKVELNEEIMLMTFTHESNDMIMQLPRKCICLTVQLVMIVFPSKAGENSLVALFHFSYILG